MLAPLHFQTISDFGDPDGAATQLIVKRCLIQLGFGASVCMNAEGAEAAMPSTMHKMAMKFERTSRLPCRSQKVV